MPLSHCCNEDFSGDGAAIGPNSAIFPVIFPVSREFPARDGFARDWLLSQPVRVSRYSPVESVKPGRFPGLSGLKPNQRRSLLRVSGANGRAVSIQELAVRFGARPRLDEAEQLLLCRPRDRKVHGPDQAMGGQFGGLPSGGESFDNVRGLCELIGKIETARSLVLTRYHHSRSGA